VIGTAVQLASGWAWKRPTLAHTITDDNSFALFGKRSLRPAGRPTTPAVVCRRRRAEKPRCAARNIARHKRTAKAHGARRNTAQHDPENIGIIAA
jgi:hypothetical protein